MSRDIRAERDRVMRWGNSYRGLKWAKKLNRASNRCAVRSNTADGYAYQLDAEAQAIAVGFWMEMTNEELKAINDEVRESKAVLQTLANDVRQLDDVIEPQLIETIKRMREVRMSLVAEVREGLQAMRDVRKFFLEDDYAAEMKRLREYVTLCRELQALQESGVIEAVADVAIKLAVR